MPERFTAVIVGCGQIAGGYDSAMNDGGVRSHAGAYRRHPEIGVIACIDPNEGARKAFQEYWQIADGFDSLETWAEVGGKADIISVCSPTPRHFDDHQFIAENAAALSVRAVFAEKPFTDTIDGSASLRDRYRRSEIAVAVNYLRRWYPEFQSLAYEIRNGGAGVLRRVVTCYNNGIVNSGSHLLDLLEFLIGPMTLKQVGRIGVDVSGPDPTVDCELITADNCPVTIIGESNRDFSLFEVRLITDRYVIDIEDSGRTIRRREVAPGAYFPNTKELGPPDVRETTHRNAMSAAIENICRALNDEEVLRSSIETALPSEELALRIRAQALGDAANV